MAYFCRSFIPWLVGFKVDKAGKRGKIKEKLLPTYRVEASEVNKPSQVTHLQ